MYKRPIIEVFLRPEHVFHSNKLSAVNFVVEISQSFPGKDCEISTTKFTTDSHSLRGSVHTCIDRL